MSQLSDALLAAGVFHNPEPPFTPDPAKADTRLRGFIVPDGLESLRNHYLLAITVRALRGHDDPRSVWWGVTHTHLWESYKTLKGGRAVNWFAKVIDECPDAALTLLDEEIPMP